MAPSTKARESAAAKQVQNTIITTDNTDPATIAQNNSGGPSVPSSSDAEYMALLAGTNFNPDGPITKATLKASAARTGRKAKNVLLTAERDIPGLTKALAGVTAEDYDADGNTLPAYAMFVEHQDFLNKKNQVNSWVKSNNLSGIALKVTFNRAPGTPNSFDPKKANENKGKKLVYIVSLSRETEEVATDSE